MENTPLMDGFLDLVSYTMTFKSGLFFTKNTIVYIIKNAKKPIEQLPFQLEQS